MHKLYDVYDEDGTQVDEVLCETYEVRSGSHIFTDVIVDGMLGQTIDFVEEAFSVEEATSRHSLAIACFLRAYFETPIEEDRHEVFAKTLGIPRDKAKQKAYEIIYKGCKQTNINEDAFV